MERRRPSNTSTSTSRSNRESSTTHIKLSLRSPCMGSATPKMEDEDDDAPRRATRGRNPLPHVTGPLFPPLPPKQPKNSPKNSPHSSRSPAVHASSTLATTTSSSALAQALEMQPPALGDVSGAAALDEDAVSARSVSPEKPDLPSASNTSLTPPPTSEDAQMEVDVSAGADDVEAEAGGPEIEERSGDDWDDYRRHRAVRGFGEPKLEVKAEPETDQEDSSGARVTETKGDGEDEDTPVKTRNGKALQGLVPSVRSRDGTPSASTPGSERAGSASRYGRKRRGEEQLLLDDHLLPADIRQVKKGKAAAKEEKDEEDDEEEAVAVEEEELEEEAIVEDDEEGKDITRCVCKREDIDVMMIQCDECNVWQHGECMGIWGDEEAPDEYFCEECKPERHQPLKKYIRSRGRNPALFIAPTPEDLERYHNDRDKFPPSQSKRWAETAHVEPPPPPPKPHSRSHHKKEQPPSPSEPAHDGRRSTRGKQAPPPSRSEKPPSAKQERDRAESKRQSVAPSHTGRRSLGGVQSVSPDRSLSPHTQSKQPNRRSTMNSRDAAYEEEVKAALEASRREMLGLPEEEPEEQVPVSEERGEKRRRGEGDEEEQELEKDRAKKGKRKKDEDEDRGESAEPSAGGGGSNKPKHPNQYTYRPKPPSTVVQPPAAPSPARRVVQGGTPAPTAPPPPLPSGPAHHEHGTRRAGALANMPVVYHPLTQETAGNLHWHLPEFLTSFADVLPGPNPLALEVRAPRNLSYLPRNHYHNQRYGPFSEERDDNGKLTLPDEPAGREPVGEAATQLDPPARVRYPLKRITMAEMRKRVRNVLEYVGRVQVEEGKRQERAKLLGIDLKALPNITKEVSTEAGDEDAHMADGELIQPEAEEPTDTAITAATSNGDESTATTATSMQLMDELTRDLIAFQELFAVPNGYASPMPTPIPAATAVFASQLQVNGSGSASGSGGGSGSGETSVPPTPIVPPTPTIPDPSGDETPNNITNTETSEPPSKSTSGEERIVADSASASVSQINVPISHTAILSEGSLDPSSDLLTGETAVIQAATPAEETEVYREGVVDKVFISSEAEREVADKLELGKEREMAAATATATGITEVALAREQEEAEGRS